MACVSCEGIGFSENSIYKELGLSFKGVVNASKVEDKDALYSAIKSGLEKGEDVYIRSDNITSDELEVSIKKVYEQYGYSGYIHSFKHVQIGDLYYIQFIYTESKDEYLRKTKIVKEKVNEIIKSIIKPEWNNFEKELAIHDYIINNTAYDYKNYKNKTIPNDDNIAYGVLVNKTAICGGYSEAMYRLLTAAGIESKVVFGDSEG
ncbi:MAG: transglutaminase-like domain-containing protein [Clostridiaceae bacterium]